MPEGKTSEITQFKPPSENIVSPHLGQKIVLSKPGQTVEDLLVSALEASREETNSTNERLFEIGKFAAGQKQRADKAEEDSITDSLTGLRNRRYLDDYVKRFDQSRTKKPVMVAFCDADNLGAINKLYGDAAGDELILNVAEILQNSVREEDIIIRKGGDEFIIIIEYSPDSDPKIIKDKISQRLESKQNFDEEFTKNNPQFIQKFSFGVIQYDSTKDKSLRDTIQRANDQMREENPHKRKRKH